MSEKNPLVLSQWPPMLRDWLAGLPDKDRKRETHIAEHNLNRIKKFHQQQQQRRTK